VNQCPDIAQLEVPSGRPSNTAGRHTVVLLQTWPAAYYGNLHFFLAPQTEMKHVDEADPVQVQCSLAPDLGALPPERALLGGNLQLWDATR
jgi:hypothetical protein